MKFKFLFAVVAFLFGFETRANSITLLDDCSAESGSALYTVFSSSTQALGGWSHIEKNESNDEYKSLPLNQEKYQIGPDKLTADPLCTGLKNQNAILVVKLSDWTRQHSNGLESNFTDIGLRFSDLDSVAIELRVNSANTRIESRESLKTLYSKYLTDDELVRLDQGKVNLGVSLDNSGKSFNAEIFLEVDQAIYADKWVRILLPIEEFDLFTQRAYQREGASLEQYGESLVDGIRINPETSQGNQLRNLLGDSWSESIPETFKQMSLSIRRIDLIGGAKP